MCEAGGFRSKFIITVELDSINPPLRLVNISAIEIITKIIHLHSCEDLVDRVFYLGDS
jgi:hypothetical protein